MCRAAMPRWYFNKDKKNCERFVSGGSLNFDINLNEHSCLYLKKFYSNKDPILEGTSRSTLKKLRTAGFMGQKPMGLAHKFQKNLVIKKRSFLFHAFSGII